MKAIIFGANGQDGFYLSELLMREGVEVIGVSRRGKGIIADVAEFTKVELLIKEHLPDFVFHFAANSTTRHSALFENHEAISTGTLNILESVKLHSPYTKVFLSGSAMQFKNDERPIDESTPFEASSPYSVARIHSVYAGRYYKQRIGLKVYTGYFFNHDSPLRSEQHVNQKIAKAVLRIASGKREKLELGNIHVQKEFSYAGDIVKAVWLLVNQESISEAIIGSGDAHSIMEWLQYCFQKINRNWNEYVTIKEDFVPEYNVLISNPGLIKSLGWKPETNFYQLADMMMQGN